MQAIAQTDVATHSISNVFVGGVLWDETAQYLLSLPGVDIAWGSLKQRATLTHSRRWKHFQNRKFKLANFHWRRIET